MAGVRKNFAATLYSNAASIGGQLLLVPVFLHFWGAKQYGSWLVLFAIPACFTFLDAGLGNSLGNTLTIAYKRSEFLRAEQLLNSFLKYQTLTLIGGYALFIIAVFALPLRHWLGVEEVRFFDFAATSLMLALYTLLSLQLGLFTAIFRAAARFNQFVLWNSHAKIVEIGGSIIVLMAGGGLVALALTLVTLRAGLLVLFWIAGRKVLPEIRITWETASFSTFKSLLAAGIAFSTLPMAAGIINQGSAVLLNQQMGPVAVVALSVARQLARLYYNLMNALFLALHPEMTLAYAAGDHERLRRLYAGGLGVVLWTSVPAILMLAIFGPFVIELWTKSTIVVGSILLMFCAIEAVIAVLGQNAALPAYASNRPVSVCLSYLICTAGGFLPAVWFVDKWGVAVLPASFALTGIVFTIHAFIVSTAIVQSTPKGIAQLFADFGLMARLGSGRPSGQVATT